MIALIDGAGKTARMAMGHFKTDAGQDYYGILADVIAGKLLAGKNLLIECESAFGGITQFKVDGSGVFINNGRMYFQSDKGGKIGLDPKYGFFQGTSSLFNVTSTGIVKPSFIDSSGRVMDWILRLMSWRGRQTTTRYIGSDLKFLRLRTAAKMGANIRAKNLIIFLMPLPDTRESL